MKPDIPDAPQPVEPKPKPKAPPAAQAPVKRQRQLEAA